MPFGTAQLASWRWITKIGSLAPFVPVKGSGVFFGSRFLRYSASFATRLACLARALPAGRALLLLPLGTLDRFAQGRQQVDDLAVLLRLGLRQRRALGLGAQQLEQLLAVGVVVLGRVARVAQVLDE